MLETVREFARDSTHKVDSWRRGLEAALALGANDEGVDAELLGLLGALLQDTARRRSYVPRLRELALT